MNKVKTFSVTLEKNYSFSKDKIIDLFRDQRFFQLTGADTIETVLKLVERLIFTHRGIIECEFTQFTDDEIKLDWNVTGFDLPDEVGTEVMLTFKLL